MPGPSATSQRKADERRARNLASANVSRQRRREQISSLEQEKARLDEVNAILRARLHIAPSGSVPPLHRLQSSTSSSSRSRHTELGPGLTKLHAPHSSLSSSQSASRSRKTEVGSGLSKLQRHKELEGAVIADMLDRAASGSKSKSTPLDLELVQSWHAASKKAPKDVSRPFQHLTDSHVHASSSSSKPSSSSKGKSGSSKRR